MARSRGQVLTLCWRPVYGEVVGLRGRGTPGRQSLRLQIVCPSPTRNISNVVIACTVIYRVGGIRSFLPTLIVSRSGTPQISQVECVNYIVITSATRRTSMADSAKLPGGGTKGRPGRPVVAAGRRDAGQVPLWGGKDGQESHRPRKKGHQKEHGDRWRRWTAGGGDRRGERAGTEAPGSDDRKCTAAVVCNYVYRNTGYSNGAPNIMRQEPVNFAKAVPGRPGGPGVAPRPPKPATPPVPPNKPTVWKPKPVLKPRTK